MTSGKKRAHAKDRSQRDEGPGLVFFFTSWALRNCVGSIPAEGSVTGDPPMRHNLLATTPRTQSLTHKA